MTDPLASLFGDMAGKQVPGGCDRCSAYQTVDEVVPGVYSLVVHHTDDCIELAVPSSEEQLMGTRPRMVAYRIARAERDGTQLAVTCPHCGATHYHGTAGQRGPVYGHRVAHCGTGDGYYVVEDLTCDDTKVFAGGVL